MNLDSPQTDVKKLKDAGMHSDAALTMHTGKVQPHCQIF